MKKVVIATDTYFPKIDGITSVLKEVVPRLAQTFDITMLAPDFGAAWSNAEVKLKVSRFLRLLGYPLIRISFGNLKKVRDAVKAADAVFIQGPALISIMAVYYGRKYRKKTVYYVHTNVWELYKNNVSRIVRWSGALLKQFMIYWYNRCDVLLVPYRNYIDELDALGITTKKEVVQLGVDIERFKPTENKLEAKQKLGIDQNCMVIGYVGRVSREKNISILLEAFKRLRERYNVKLLIVGSGTDMDIFKDERNIILPGFQKDVAQYYQAMDIFVMPSLTETTSLATLEAMACGIPVITTKVGFLKDYVHKDYNGLHFPKGNAHNLILQLKKLLRNPERLKDMGENARATAMTFSWENTIRKIKEVLEKD